MPRAAGAFDRPGGPRGRVVVQQLSGGPALLLLLMQFQQGSDWSFYKFSRNQCQKKSSNADGVFLTSKKREIKGLHIVVWSYFCDTVHMSQTVSYFFVASWKHIYIFYITPAIFSKVIWANLITRLALHHRKPWASRHEMSIDEDLVTVQLSDACSHYWNKSRPFVLPP